MLILLISLTNNGFHCHACDDGAPRRPLSLPTAPDRRRVFRCSAHITMLPHSAEGGCPRNNAGQGARTTG